ncbi:MAG: ABC transporter permease [Hyphomonadaceae bacterium]
MTSAWFMRARLRARHSLSGLRPAIQPYEGARADLVGDLIHTWRQRDLCLSLAYQRSISRFRRTFLGPIWIIVSFIVATLGLSLLWAIIMNRDFELYFPYVTLGMFIWNFLIGTITDGANALNENKSLALQTRTPMIMYPIVGALKQSVIAAHNIPYVGVVLFLYAPGADWSMLLAVLGAAIVFFFALAGGVILSIWCAYLPDLSQVIAAGMRFLFFFVPILWMPFQRAQFEALWMANPLFHALNVVRGPLLDQPHVLFSFAFAGAATLAAWAAAISVYWAGAGAVSTRL